MKLLAVIFFIPLFISCTSNKKLTTANESSETRAMPACLQTIVNNMAEEPNGSPQSVTQYMYKQQPVFYLVSPCCDKYNIVYDSACNILGYPDGGYTGKGDEKMTDFKAVATDARLIWSKDKTEKTSN